MENFIIEGKNLVKVYTIEQDREQEITIPEGVEVIKSSAIFSYNIAKLNLPTSLKVIETNGIYCPFITELKIPEGVEKIETRGIAHCFGLKEVTLPVTVKEVCDSAFNTGKNVVFKLNGEIPSSWGKEWNHCNWGMFGKKKYGKVEKIGENKMEYSRLGKAIITRQKFLKLSDDELLSKSNLSNERLNAILYGNEPTNNELMNLSLALLVEPTYLISVSTNTENVSNLVTTSLIKKYVENKDIDTILKLYIGSKFVIV